MREAAGNCRGLAEYALPSFSFQPRAVSGGGHTASVVMKVSKLFAPLRDDAQCVFDEGDNDEEAAYHWEVSNPQKRNGQPGIVLMVCETGRELLHY